MELKLDITLHANEFNNDGVMSLVISRDSTFEEEVCVEIDGFSAKNRQK